MTQFYICFCVAEAGGSKMSGEKYRNIFGWGTHNERAAILREVFWMFFPNCNHMPPEADRIIYGVASGRLSSKRFAEWIIRLRSE